LESQPILEAIFEIRVDSISQPLAAVLPGALVLLFPDRKSKFERLPASMMPDAIRQNDSNFAWQPLVKVTMDGYSYLIGDRVVTFACKIPYPGWSVFKNRIMELLNVFVSKLQSVSEISRYSMKYIDFIPGDDVSKLRQLVALEVAVGTHKILSDPLTIRAEIREDKYVKLISISAPAQIQKPGSPTQTGVVTDIDLIANTPTNLSSLLESNGELLDSIHARSKEAFFDVLTPQALVDLGAKYD